VRFDIENLLSLGQTSEGDFVDRRDFLKTSMIATAGVATGVLEAEGADSVIRHEGKIVTVRGPILPDKLGFTLPHEHILVDFIGADKVSPDRYD
jgi:hypothetical protein